MLCDKERHLGNPGCGRRAYEELAQGLFNLRNPELVEALTRTEQFDWLTPLLEVFIMYRIEQSVSEVMIAMISSFRAPLSEHTVPDGMNVC
ncbi:hypothetical protein COOONC_02160 [Cooperia oncophora]